MPPLACGPSALRAGDTSQAPPGAGDRRRIARALLVDGLDEDGSLGEAGRADGEMLKDALGDGLPSRDDVARVDVVDGRAGAWSVIGRLGELALGV